MRKNRQRIRIQSKKQASPQEAIQQSLYKIARAYMRSERKLARLIKAQSLPPVSALILIATYTEGVMAGATDTYTMSEKELLGTTNLLLELWKKGLFTPSPAYPYSLRETLLAIAESEGKA